MKTRARSGVVLLQVLVGGVVLCYISSMILKMTLQPAMISANALNAVTDGLGAAASFRKATAAWDANAGVTCTSSTGPGTLEVDCGAPPPPIGSCVCVCTVAGHASVSSTGPSTGPCTLTLVP